MAFGSRSGLRRVVAWLDFFFVVQTLSISFSFPKIILNYVPRKGDVYTIIVALYSFFSLLSPSPLLERDLNLKLYQ